MNMPVVKILAISGSLRANSSNNAVLKAVAAMVPAGVQFNIYNDLAQIPPFDDSQETPLPMAKPVTQSMTNVAEDQDQSSYAIVDG